ncbi:MAG: dienelactone hydrolase family protein [Paracoccaceae bacterium]
MADIVLFHSILGLRAAEQEIAGVFEAAGHRVSVPDLFGGRAADDYDTGFAIRQEVGDAAIRARAKAAVEASAEDVVLAGVSFGAFLIRELWDMRPKMAGALLFAGIAPWMAPLRPGFAVSAHIAQPDPFDDEAFFGEWVGEAGDVALELHRYKGAGHYFLDRSLPDYNAAAAALCLERSLAFLERL